jgi:hypothetical protein
MKINPSPRLEVRIVLGAALALNSWMVGAQQPGGTGAAVAAQQYDFSTPSGPHHRRVEVMVDDRDPQGNPVQRLSRYTEVATGLNFLDANGVWQPTVEQMSPHPERAAALAGYYKVVLKRNINQSGAVRLITPDGKEVKNNPLGLYYVPGAVDVLGIANMGATVTVGGQATYRRGEYFQTALSINNSSAPAYQSVTTTAINGGSSNNVTGNVLLPAANETYGPDLDGNTISDGLWSYSWNAENKLVTVQSVSGVPSAAKRLLSFEYDYLVRRISKTVYAWNGSSYVWQSLTKFLYDGWNLIGEFDVNNAILRANLWGLDLSGSMQGAGGVGGLAAVVPGSGISYFPAYDGNRNVVAHIDGSTGQLAAQFEYGPFGEVIRATSSISPAIPIRWSTNSTLSDSGDDIL